MHVHICIYPRRYLDHQFSTAVTNFGKRTKPTFAQSARKLQATKIIGQQASLLSHKNFQPKYTQSKNITFFVNLYVPTLYKPSLN